MMYMTRRDGVEEVRDRRRVVTKESTEYLEGSLVLCRLKYSGPCRPAIVPPPHGRILPGYKRNFSCDTKREND